MRIQVTVDLAALRGVSVQRSVEVLLDAPSGTSFAAVRGPLAEAAGLGEVEHGLTFISGGQAISPTSAVGEPPLLDGVLIHVMSYAAGRATEPPRAPEPPGLLELHVVSGQGAGRRFPLGRGTHHIGRARSCTIRLEDRGVSRVHAHLDITADGAHVSDLEPSNPSLLEGEPLPRGRVRLALGRPLRVGSTTLVLRRVEGTRAQTTIAEGVVAVHRPPRFDVGSSTPSIAFPEGPKEEQGHRLPLLASLAPVAIAGVLAVITSSPMMLLFALMSPVMLLGQWAGDRRHGRVSYRKQLAQHQTQVEELCGQVARALGAEAARRRLEHPDLATVGTMVTGPGTRLWERRPGDGDHLVVRVGLGTQLPRLELTGAVPADVDAARVDDVPVLVDLAEAMVVGVSGPRARVLSQAASILLQLASWHSPRILRLAVVTSSPNSQSDWGWVTRLPHARRQDGSARIAAVLGSTGEAATRLLAELRDSLAPQHAAPGAPHRPSGETFVVVLDGAHDLRRSAGVAELLATGPEAGLVCVCLDEVVERLPAETRAQVELDSVSAPRAVVRSSDGVTGGVVPDLPSRAWVEHLARSLAPLRDATPAGGPGRIPDRIGLRELYTRSGLGLDPTDPAALTQHWQDPGRPRAALLGWSANGPFELDLRHDGPHALIGGTTGAGKSELLQTLIAGLAIGHHPEELSLVLVDYKGGAALAECSRLPHAVGVVTDLDEHLAARALSSLAAELKRRERLLAQHGAKDLEELLRRWEEGPPPIPRLVIVVDEFKMLADELPEFVDGLVRLAAVGRSLGVHLVLATQRPGGIVSGDMRANIALRIALRVRDRSDSTDVVECPDAASISDRLPGRALIRTAGLDLVEVQTAYAGGPVAPQGPQGEEPPMAWPLSWSDLGSAPPSRPQTNASGTRTELAAVVDAACEAAEAVGAVTGTAPWLPPLPDQLPVARLGARASMRHSVPLGLVDRPTLQRQDLLTWDLRQGVHLGIVGGSRTGRTTTLRTLALSLAEALSPAEGHLYVLEGTPGQLRHLDRLPHVGGVLGVDEPRLARRLVGRLLDDATTRRASPGEGRPDVVLLVDGWETIEDAFESMDHGGPTEDLIRLLRDGPSAGISLAIAGGRALTSGRVASLLQQRLVLAMGDPLDLTLAGVSPGQLPDRPQPGRAVDPLDGCQVQLAHAGTSPEPDDQDHAVSMAATVSTLEYAALPPEVLPWRLLAPPDLVTLGELEQPVGGSALGVVPVGIGGDTHELLGFQPSTQRRILVAGPPRSGRSTALAVLAHQLSRQGRTVAVVAPGSFALGRPQGIRGAHVLGATDSEAFIALRRETPDLAVLVDDADTLDGSPIASALLEMARLVDTAGGLIAAAVDLHRASGLYRGLVPEVALHATGLLLGARTPTDGEIFRMRVEPDTRRLPGRGLIVADGTATPIQVATP